VITWFIFFKGIFLYGYSLNKILLQSGALWREKDKENNVREKKPRTW